MGGSPQLQNWVDRFVWWWIRVRSSESRCVPYLQLATECVELRREEEGEEGEEEGEGEGEGGGK